MYIFEGILNLNALPGSKKKTTKPYKNTHTKTKNKRDKKKAGEKYFTCALN